MIHLALFAIALLSARVDIPAEFIAGGVYVDLPTANGKTLRLYTDSGGGSLILSRAAADRIGLPTTPIGDPEAKAELGPDAASAEPPALAPGLPPLPDRVFVAARAAQIPSWPEQGDGVVGAKWFEGGVWTWDYPGHRLWKEGSDWTPGAAARRAPLGFKQNADGSRPNNFPRITVEIDGRPVAMLLDTGAETVLTPAALARLDDGGPALRATSMIAASDFDAWHRRHPDWPVIEDAQLATHSAMIRVPSVTIAGLKTGPVWFTRRPDRNFRTFMSGMMDAPVEGSIGGNALGQFVMTIDYPRAVAWFTPPD